MAEIAPPASLGRASISPAPASASTPVLVLRSDTGRLPSVEPQIIPQPFDLPDDHNPAFTVSRAPDSPAAAPYRALRHRLAERGDPRTLLITSAARGEGRTCAAFNLASALAEPHRFRVLLIEADVGRPSLARLLKLEITPSACFLTQLEEHKAHPERPWRVAVAAPSGLEILAIAPSPEKKGDDKREDRRLAGPSFRAAIEQLRWYYDYIVIDGPPIDAGPDVNIIEDTVRGLLFVARRIKTRGRSLKAALEQVSPANVLGIVLMNH